MAPPVNAPLYTTEILRLAARLPEPTTLERVDGSAERRSPTCGSTVRTEVQIVDGTVVALSQSVQACAFGQAAAAILSADIESRDRDDVAAALAELTAWLAGERSDPGRWAGLEALAAARSRPARHGAILLPFRALLAAMEEAR